jgi:P27 family predicted phage terminase small subunit
MAVNRLAMARVISGLFKGFLGMPGNSNSGRRPQPTTLKILRGNPSKTRLNANEPQPARAGEHFDVPPTEISDDPVATAEWVRLAPMLRKCGLVSEAEKASLLVLCQQWSRYLEAHGKVKSLGMIVKKPSGIPTVNPYLAVSDRALTHCIRLWVELGLTPSGRARMSALPSAEAEPTSKWAGLL